MKKVLIGILGRKHHGKDTISDYLVDKYNFTKIAIGDPLKEACRILFDFNNDQLYGDKKEEIDEYWGTSPRKVYQYIGTDIFRNDINKIMNIDDKFWVKKLLNTYNKIDGNVVVSDVRFQNEVDIIKENNGIVIKVVRPNYKYDSNDTHISENAIDEIKNYDYLIINDKGINELYFEIEKIISSKL